jgi:outer membrane biosynthesis protein TonB
MPQTLKDKLPLGKIELTIANWFKDKAPLKSIYITEPIYTSDLTDRVDLALFVGGFDTSEWFAELEKKSTTLKRQAIARGLITEDWQVVGKAEPQPEVVDVEAPLEVVAEPVEAQTETPPQVVEEQPKPQTQPPEAIAENVKAEVPAPAQPKRARRSRKPKATTKDETAEAEVPAKPKRSRRATKKASANST